VRAREDPGDEDEQEQRDRERRRRRREERQDKVEAVGDTFEVVDSVRACGSGCGRGGGGGCGGGGGRGGGGGGGDCSCDGPGGCTLLGIGPLLLVAAAVVPARGARGLVRASMRGYQRWLSRFTPACPSTPSCSAYALAAVGRHGARRGLRLAAARVRNCGLPPDGYAGESLAQVRRTFVG
jgi:putative component of membrane protein insertase Oxa1/YidC/SpoIIIJ protein YidD